MKKVKSAIVRIQVLGMFVRLLGSYARWGYVGPTALAGIRRYALTPCCGIWRKEQQIKTPKEQGCEDLLWKPVEDARMYQVYMNEGDPEDPSKWKMVTVSSRTRNRVSGLLPGKFYSFRVTALGRIGEGPASDIVSGLAA